MVPEIQCFNCDGTQHWRKVLKRNELNTAPAYNHRIVVQSGGQPGCTVAQVPGRDHTEPQFFLEFGVTEDRSRIDIDYCVGTVPGGCDVQNHETLGGTSAVVSKVKSDLKTL